jgi:hypothetical protein
MNKTKAASEGIKIALGIAMLVASAGCGGYGAAGYYGGGGTVVVAAPEGGFWGGDYDRGRDAHLDSHRGIVSRSVAHPAGGRAVAQAGGDRARK